jgi:23S rRNA (adenine1618-N6)-methyltransferase
MHPRNRYARTHDFLALARVEPALTEYFILTPAGHTSLDFTKVAAVRLLNKALLVRDYGLKFWDIPAGSLCPGVPGRLDYVHVLADLLGAQSPVPAEPDRDHATHEKKARPRVQGRDKKQTVRGLDVGTGASLIYPILAVGEYGWRMVGTDVDATSLRVAGAIAKFNPVLKGKVSVRAQPDTGAVFKNVIYPNDYFDFTMCNPPFFDAPEAAQAAARQKWDKLGASREADSPTLNFGGRDNELWTAGGEPAFLRKMIRESADFAGQVGWFTTLVSKKGYLKIAELEFGRLGITDFKTIGIGGGGKVRRVLCWRK